MSQAGQMSNLAISEWTTYSWSFEQDVQRYAELGIGSMAVWRQKLSDFGEEKGVKLLAETGMRVSSLLWAGGFTGSDGRSYRESVDDAAEAIRLAAAMQAACLVVYTGGRGGHTHNHVRRLARKAFEELLPLSCDLEVVLAIEPMHVACATEWTFLTDLDETLNFLDDFSSSDLKLVFDTYHLAQDVSILDRLPELLPRIGIVHLGDAKKPPRGEQNRCLLGDGKIPVKELTRSLISAGYDGFFDIELMGEEIETIPYEHILRHSQAAFAELIGGNGVGSTSM